MYRKCRDVIMFIDYKKKNENGDKFIYCYGTQYQSIIKFLYVKKCVLSIFTFVE